MKKTVKHPDGSEETIEGTADEIAEYERKLKQESPKKKKDILKGKGVEACPCDPCTQTREWFRTIPQIVPMTNPNPFVPYEPNEPWYPYKPIWAKPFHGGMCACKECCPTVFSYGTSSDLTFRNTPYEHEATNVTGDGYSIGLLGTIVKA